MEGADVLDLKINNQAFNYLVLSLPGRRSIGRGCRTSATFPAPQVSARVRLQRLHDCLQFSPIQFGF